MEERFSVPRIGRIIEAGDDPRVRRSGDRLRRRTARGSGARSRTSRARARVPRSNRRRIFRSAHRRAPARPSLRRRRRRRERRRRRCARSPQGFGHRRQIDRAERFHQRGDRFHVARDAEVLAVGDAAFEAAGVVGRPGDADRVGRSPPGFGTISSWTREPGSAAAAGPRPMPTALIAGIDIMRLRQPAVELAIPLHVAAEADGHAGARSLRSRRPWCRRPRGARSISAIISRSTSGSAIRRRFRHQT